MNKQKILIVDDDANIAELIALYLTKECFDTRMVHDGEMALEVFDNYQPNLIILDLMLPVKAVLRRYQPVSPNAVQNPNLKCVSYDDLVVNLSNYSVLYYDKAIEMPPKELELLYFLASSPNQVFTREQLLDNIWGYEYIGDTRTVDVHVKRLREKIKDHDHWRIATVWGIGYKFEVK